MERFHWLHLTKKRLEWPERFFKRHGAKTVFVARFVALFPPIAANLLAGMTKISWPSFLFYNLTGSAAYTTTYILLGYWFGKKWKIFIAWLGPTACYLLVAGIAFVLLGVIFRHRFSKLLVRLFSGRRSQ